MKSNFRVWFIALLGMFVFGITDAYAGGNIYSRARAFLKEGSPTAAGKVYVSTSSSTPSASSYKNCTSSTTAASSAQVEGASKTTTYHFWATANAGYKFTGWYSKNASGVYTLVSSNAHYSVGVTTGSAPSSGTEYVDKDLYAEFIKLVQLSFIVPTNGTYDISHKGAAVADYASFTVDGPVKLTAHPAAGYKLRGWYTSTNGGVTKKYFAFGNTCEPNNLTADATIGADFVLDDGKATFWPKGSSSVYDDLNAAISATGSGGIIVVVSDGTLPAGDYTINDSKTLLLPYSTTNNKMIEPNIVHVTAAGSAPALSVYRKLTLAPGANITVNSGSSICLGGSIASVNGGNASSFPCGPSGVLDLSQGGEITLKSGATLYAWGFVQGQNMDQGNNTSGVGRIIAKSGSTVWEDYQVGDWRGGTASSSIYSSRSSWKFFPFQSWTIQNVEAPIEFQKGANGKGFWTIFGDGQVFTVKFDYLASSGSLFTLNKEGATLEKWYDPTTDKVCYQLGGGSTLDAMTLTAMGTTITTNDYNLPVPCNMSIILKSDTFSVSKPVVMHAGANMEVKSGAVFRVATSVYMFDQSEWGKYCMYYGGSDVYFQEFNTMTKHYTRGARTAKTNLTDAAIEVNGTMVVTGSGKLYSTASGCQVTGNNGGVVRFAGSLPSSTSIIMCSNLKNTNSVSMANVNLQNEDQTFTKSKGSSYFDNVNGRWFIRSAKNAKSDHTWDFTYIKSGAKNGTGGTDATVSAVYSNDRTGDVDRMKWFNVTADECDDWWVGPSSYLYNWTLNDAWHQFIPTGGGMYSGSDGVLHQKGADCEWDVPDYPQEGCFYNVGGTLKALVGAELIEVEANSPDDHAWHKKGAASTYYICLPGCIWKAVTKTTIYGGGDTYNQAYTTTSGGKKYIWYGDQWLEATEDAPYFQARIDNKLKYFEWNGSAWTLMEPVAEVTKKGTTAEYIRFSDAWNAIDSATANTTVRLLKNINLTSGVTYSNNKQVTFNLNGFTLSGGVNELITINNASAIFIVIDGSAGGTGKIDMTFAKADARSTAINVVAGRLILNSGNIHAENTHASQPTCAIELANGTTFTQNGGRVEAASAGDTWGIHTASGSTTAQVNINGGVDSVSTTATNLVVSAIMSEGGKVNMSGGTIKVSAIDSKGWQGGTAGIRLNHANSRLAMNGGTIIANAKAYARGIYITSSSAKDTINGGVIRSVADSVCAFGIQTYGQTIVNDIDMDVTGKDWGTYGIYNEVSGSNLWVNGGRFNIHNTASSRVVGVYSNNGNGTINGGEFTITSKNGGAYGFYLKNDILSFVVNGGKFKVTGNNGADTTSTNAAIWAEEGGDTGTKFKIAGGYYNMTSNLGARIAEEKGVFALDPEVEGDLIEDGYIRKVRGVEHTITWKNRDNTLIKTELVESGKVPVYTGATPTYSTPSTTYEFDGWCTAEKNGGTYYSGALPVVSADVTYYAHYDDIFAEVIANGTTTRYTNVTPAWTAAMAYEQATIRILSDAGNLVQLVFNPTPDNAIITLDLNGHTWGMNGTKDTDKDCFIKVNKAGCKLIITDNSVSGNGYVQAAWAKSSNLYGVKVDAGECILQNGTIKCNNTSASNYAHGVYVASGGTFTMLGGKVESTKNDAAVTSGTAYGVYVLGAAELAAGKIKATNSVNQSMGVYTVSGSVVNLGADVEVTCNSGGYGVYGSGTVNVDGGKYDVTTTAGTAYGFYPIRNATGAGSYHISGNPTITVKAGASGVRGVSLETKSGYTAEGVTVEIDSATFNLETTTRQTGSVYGIYNINNGEVVVHKATMNLTPYGGSAAAIYACHRSHTVIEDGTYTVTTKEDDTNSYWNMYSIYNVGNSAIVDVRGGHFTVTNNSKTTDEWAVKATGGTTKFSGNTKIEGDYIFYIATGYTANGVTPEEVAEVIIDGGEYIAGKTMFNSRTAAQDGHPENTVRGDITVKDGYFDSPTGSGKLIATSQTPVANLKIYGGWFKANEDGKLSVYADPGNTTGYVREPSTVETLSSGAEYDAGYRYHVISNHAITWNWNDGETTSRTDQVLHNTMPDYGGIPTHSGTDTYEFLGWKHGDDTVTIAKEDLTYTAQWRKLEAEVIEGDDTIRYETFTEAFNYAKTLSESTVRILSDLEYGTMITLDSLCVLTIDLNNHTVNYTSKDDGSYALTINRAGSKLIIDDRSIAKEGEFTHFESKEGRKLHGVHLQNGELELAGGTLRARNSTASSAAGAGAYAVVGENGTVFTQTGGKLVARCRMDARAYSTTGTGTFNATGGTIEVTTKYTVSSTNYYGTAVYGVLLSNNGTFNMSGTAAMSVTTGTGAYGVYVDGSGGTGYPEANISGGSITCLAKDQCQDAADANGSMSRPVQSNGTHATATISGGNFTTNGAAGKYNIEDVVCTNGGTVDITGGNFRSSAGGNCVGVRVFSGTATIGGDAYFDSKRGVVVGDWAEADGTIGTAIINGGTFNCSENALYANETTHDAKTVTGTMYVNGGYFKAASGKTICNTSSGVGRLILNGGYYNETSSTTQKSNITTYKGGSATVQDIASTDPAYSDGYRYHISTPYTVTWEYGDVSESETVDCGVMPSKDLTTYTYGGKIYYVTGWSPALSVVTGNITYTAVSEAYEAAVTVDETTTRYTSFADAWEYAMAQTEATVTLLNNANLSTQIIYAPTVENGRHTLDLNNFTLSYTGTGGAFLKTNRADARLTITDNSVGAGGILRHHTDYAGTSYAAYLYGGELVLSGGQLSVQNTTASKNATCVFVNPGATFTMTGGHLYANAKSTAKGISIKGTATISGSADIDVDSEASAYSIDVNNAGTATVSGGTFDATTTTFGVFGIYVQSGASATVSGGTFSSLAGNGTVDAKERNVECFGAYVTGDGSSLSISGGTFNANSSDNTGGNMNIVRVQVGSTATISGGTFQSNASSTIGLVSFGGVTTVSGTALFRAKTGVTVGTWYAGDGTNNVTATVNLNGGTFDVTGYVINATWSPKKDAESPFVNSVINVNGGHYKTTGSNIIYKKANGGGTATLTINGGYFNEKSGGTTFKDQINTHKGSGKQIVTINEGEDEYTAGYRYEVVDDSKVAKVNNSGTVTYYTTLASAITAANLLTTNPTVTMLQDVNTTSEYELSKTMTIDLNGKTITSTRSDNQSSVFKMNASGKTLTIRDSGTGGKIDHSATVATSIVGIYVKSGSLVMESGIIYAKNPSTTNSSQAFGIATASGCGLTMTGGTVTAEAYKEARGLWLNGTTSLTDATVTSTSTNDVSYAVQANAGALTVHSGTYSATGTTGYAVRERDGTVSIEGGKFSGSTQDFIKEDGTASISGGYYVHNTGLATYVTAPDYVLATTAADKAAQGNAYNWKVAEGYTLTWNLDGGTVSVAGTGAAVAATGSPSTTWAVGDAIVAPTVVKTNYVFAGWSSTPAATMPAEDVTYTATWTAAEASVAIGEGDPVYYATLAEAFTASKAGNNAVITILKDISSSDAITYNPATAYTCTLDMNSHTVAYTGSASTFLTVNRLGCKLIITDNTIAKGGKLKFDGNNSSGVKLVNIEYGEVELQNDTLYARNANASGSAIGVYTIRHAAKFTMTGGAIEAVRSTGGGAYGLRLNGLTNITGGVIKATTAGSDAFGVYSVGDTLNIGGSVSVNVTVGTSTMAAIRLDGAGSVCNISGGIYTVNQTTSGSDKWNLECIRMNYSTDDAKKCHITGGTFTATHTGSNETYAVRIRGGELTIDDAVFNVNNGIYSDSEAKTASVTINGGTFNCSGTYGFNITNANCSLSVTGGKFNCSSSVVASSQTGTITVTGGYYSKNTINLASYVTAPKYVMATTAADKAAQGSAYNYKVAEAYTLTWDLAGGTVVEAGTGADVATTGTPSIRWAVGDAITAPTVVKSGYAFAGWSSTPAATMPAANTTYTATWTEAVAEVTINGITTGYANFSGSGSAWAAANSSASYPATIKLLKDVSVSGKLLYNNANNQNCTLDLNGHTITTTTDDRRPLHINNSSITFTITDSSVGKSGKLSMTSTYSDNVIYGAHVHAGTLVLNAGTIEVKSSSQETYGVTVGSDNTFTMNGGTIHVKTTDSKAVRGLYSGGTATIHGGTIHVEAAGDAYGLYQSSSGTITVKGGKFNITAGSTAYMTNKTKTNATVSIQGGYYNINTNLATCVSSPYHVVSTTSADKAVIGSDYNYQVTNEGGDSGPLDIVDYSATSVTLNMNGYTSAASQANWKILAYGNTYTKTNRELDRTLVVDISSASLSADDTIRIDGTASDGETVESHYLYIMPHIFTENTTLNPASVKATSVLYVKSDTLTINADVRVNKVYVCADAMLAINSGKTLTVDTLVLRTKPFHSAELLNNGTLSATKVYYTRQIANKSTYYEIALPYDVTLANVRFSNGKPATYGSHYGLMEYSGQSRANNGPNTSLNWQTLNPASVTTMSGKKAYEMISASAYYYEFYFPVTYSKRADGAEVAVTAYTRAEGETPKGDKGWNYITTPYTHTFECDYGESPEDGLKIAWRAEDNTSFNQDVATAIKPTQAFYYQTETTGSLVFKAEDFHFAAMPRRAAQRLSTQWIRLHYSEDAEGASADVTNIYLNDEKFTSAYETGYDVAKWSLDGGQPLIWTVVGSDKLAFAALPDSVATNSIPLTVFNPTAGAFTFSLELNRYMKRLEHVYLWDTYTNTTVDLMEEDYTETLGAGTIEGRFFLYTRNVPAVTTDIDLINGGAADADSAQPRKVIIEDKVFIIRGEHIYSIDGQLVK